MKIETVLAAGPAFALGLAIVQRFIDRFAVRIDLYTVTTKRMRWIQWGRAYGGDGKFVYSYLFIRLPSWELDTPYWLKEDEFVWMQRVLTWRSTKGWKVVLW